MDSNTASGAHESPGAVVHLCNKCGWRFPNPHPSAKQRRAHKRACGTIQRHELDIDVDMDPTLSDDDHSKTPSPKLVNKSDCEKTSGGIVERSNRSEDDLFSDAVMEFSDSGYIPGVEECPNDAKVAATDLERSGEKDLTVFHSFKDLIETSSNSTVSSQIHNPEVPENATAFPGSNLMSQVHVSSTTEESADEDVREGLMAYVGQETDAKGSGKIDPDRNVVPILATDAADTAQNKVGAEQGLDFAISVNSNESFSGKEEGNENVYELSVLADIPMVDHAETMLEDFKDHKGVKLHKPVKLDNENVNELSVLADIPVVDHAEMMLEDFKYHKGVKLHQPVTLDSCEIIEDKKDDVEDPPSEVIQVSALDMHAVNPLVAPSEVNDISLHDTENHEKSTTEMCDVVEKDEREIIKEEYFAKNIIVTSDSVSVLPEFQANTVANLHGSDDADDGEQGKVEKCDGVGVESQEEPLETKLTASESNNNLHEAQVVDEDVRDLSVMKLSETNLTSINGVSDAQDIPKQIDDNGNDKERGKYDAKHGRNNDTVEGTSVEHETKAYLLSPSNTESSMQFSVAVDDNYAIGQDMGHSGINQSSQGENDDNNFVKHQFGASVIDVSVDSLSLTDSLEGNWGSISVLSTQSDIPAFVNAENLVSTDNTASVEAEKLKSNKSEGATERQQSEKSDIFEAPSFMTLVEPVSASDQKADASDKETVHNLRQQNAPSQAGWFPSLTNVVNDSEGRKKNEEIIAKVTNWSTGKQHTPLKTLLGEANVEAKPKSPNPKENKALINKENGGVPMTVSAILGPEVPPAEPGKRETGKEVNYRADIKREEMRKVKGRPYWVKFVCCLSVN